MHQYSIFECYSSNALPILLAPATVPALIIHSHTTGDPLVTISLVDGSIEFGPNYDPDEAARTFWDAIRGNFASRRTI